jgi:hypothetical protein
VAEGEVAVTPLPKAPGAQFGTYRDRKTFAIEAAKHFVNAPALVHVPDVTNSLALEHWECSVDSCFGCAFDAIKGLF